MTLIPASETLALRRHLAQRLTAPVTMHFFQQPATRPGGAADGLACGETLDLLEEVAALSDRLRLEVHDVESEAALGLGVSRVPATVLVGAARGRVRWLGLPTGHELGALLGDLIDVSAGATSLRAASRRALAGLRRDLRLSVFVTPACPVCPAVARLAHQLAVESPRVSADVIEAAEFPDLLERFRVGGVPTVIVNERQAVVGAVDEASFVRRVLAAA
jgi:glutaredoxin-like protein